MTSTTAYRPLGVERLRKTFVDRAHSVAAVDGVSFEVEEGQFYTLLGPSGCGKTTTLRCVAGLEQPDAGRIVVDDKVVASDSPRVFVPPHKRGIGMVFQSYAIWPHMNVFENVAFPLRVRRVKVSKQDLTKRVEEALATVQLTGYEQRSATTLSGGQQQRLALARALVGRPKVLLLDEPLSNLDAKLRDRMRKEIRDLQRGLGITTLYVTHDQVEALSMSNKIAVMHQGQVVQESTPREIYLRPAARFVADFVGTSNFMDAEVRGAATAGGTALLAALIGELRVNPPEGVVDGERVVVAVRPENVRVHQGDPGERLNTYPATVEEVTFLGESVECRVRAGQQLLLSRQHPNLRLRVGDHIWVELPAEQCAVITETHGVSSAPYIDEATLATST